MGVSGAAVATFIAIVVGVVWISIYFIDAKAYLRFHFAPLETATCACGGRC